MIIRRNFTGSVVVFWAVKFGWCAEWNLTGWTKSDVSLLFHCWRTVWFFLSHCGVKFMFEWNWLVPGLISEQLWQKFLQSEAWLKRSGLICFECFCRETFPMFSDPVVKKRFIRSDWSRNLILRSGTLCPAALLPVNCRSSNGAMGMFENMHTMFKLQKRLERGAEIISERFERHQCVTNSVRRQMHFVFTGAVFFLKAHSTNFPH